MQRTDRGIVSSSSCRYVSQRASSALLPQLADSLCVCVCVCVFVPLLFIRAGEATAVFMQIFNVEPNVPIFGSEVCSAKITVAFSALFFTHSALPCCSQLVAALDSLAEYNREDADTLNVLARSGSGGSLRHTASGEHSVEAVLERRARREEAESAVATQIEQARAVCLSLLDAAKQYIEAELTQLRGRKIHGAAVRNAEHSRQEALRGMFCQYHGSLSALFFAHSALPCFARRGQRSSRRHWRRATDCERCRGRVRARSAAPCPLAFPLVVI